MNDMDERLPQPVHGAREDSSPAPGALELVRSFLSLHDHSASDGATLQPGLTALTWWLRTQNLIPVGIDVSQEDFAWALSVRDALVDKVRENMGAKTDADADMRLNEAAADTGLRPRFDDPRLLPSVGGVRGAIGRLLGVAFMAELDGSWQRFRLCADATCTTVFYDRSKNHSAKWCSMQTCGNRGVSGTRRRRDDSDPTATGRPRRRARRPVANDELPWIRRARADTPRRGGANARGVVAATAREAAARPR